jgi:hypothetical protein
MLLILSPSPELLENVEENSSPLLTPPPAIIQLPLLLLSLYHYLLLLLFIIITETRNRIKERLKHLYQQLQAF